jgi:predicted 2-oxoglutarate/Fe(II)-dependent dioxygenase YbiX
MPGADFFRRLGVLILPQFLDAALCDELVDAMLGSPGSPARMAGPDFDGYVDEHSRSARLIDLGLGRTAPLTDRVGALRPDFERFFGLPLADHGTVDAVIYPSGGFFLPHRDRGAPGDSGDPEIERRALTVVVMLNRQASAPARGEYSGGDLRLFGLIPDDPWRTMGFAVEPSVGQLIAFRAETLHDVTPVTAGNRCVLVCWFH